MTNIKYFGFAKVGASVPVLGLTLSPSDEEDIKIEVSKVTKTSSRYWVSSTSSTSVVMNARELSRSMGAGTVKNMPEALLTLPSVAPAIRKGISMQQSTR